MKKRLLTAVFGLLVVAILAGFALNAYLNRPGRFCYRNYERIQIGMTRTEVEALLGSPGKEIQWEALPQSPGGSRPVTGDRFFQWKAPDNYNGGEIIVGMRDDRVCDKWYWEYSL